MRTIAILNFKGGVGKTVTTATLACLLAKKADTVIRVFCGIPTVIKGEETL